MTPDEAIDAVARWTGLRLTLIDLRRTLPFTYDVTHHRQLIAATLAEFRAVERDLLAAGLLRPRVKSRRKKSGTGT